MGLHLPLYRVVNVLRLVEQRNKMFLWICCRVDKLKIILSRDFNAVAFPNMNQPASSDSSATFMDQNNMYPPNGFPMQERNTSATFMAQNNMYPRDDFGMQERNIIPGSSAARTNSYTRITQNTAAAGTC